MYANEHVLYDKISYFMVFYATYNAFGLKVSRLKYSTKTVFFSSSKSLSYFINKTVCSRCFLNMHYYIRHFCVRFTIIGYPSKHNVIIYTNLYNLKSHIFTTGTGEEVKIIFSFLRGFNLYSLNRKILFQDDKENYLVLFTGILNKLIWFHSKQLCKNTLKMKDIYMPNKTIKQ